MELRDLMRFIDPKAFDPIITDFKDIINSTGDAVEEEVDFKVTIEDFKTLSEKTLFFIQEHPDEPLVKEVQNIIRPTKQAIRKFKSEVVKIAKTAEEYNEIFREDNDLVVFIRKNLELNPEAVDKFAQIFVDKGFNEMQIRYIRELLLFISQNGYFTRQVLLLEELNFKDLFDSEEIKLLIEEIEQRM